MCLNKSSQPIKFIILFMVISCQGNYVNSVSPAHQKAQGSGMPHLTKAQIFFTPAWTKHLIVTHLSMGLLLDLLAQKENTVHHFYFSLINHLACTKVNYKWMVTYSSEPLESSSAQASPPAVLCALMLSQKDWHGNSFLKKSSHWHKVVLC